ncbi:MAG TPA: DUF5050 domain-containing protein [Syntrophomonadaceae bacterium]|nr:DUF5050 domain-containing protein [Syntrophomonadaceae bacterium]
MKQIIAILAFILAMLFVPLPAKADDTPRVFLDGQELSFDVPPVVVDGRVLVPLRQIFDYLSLPLIWDSNTMTAGYGKTCCTIGCTKAWIENKEITLDVPPMLINSRTMVPLRFMAEAAHCAINYNPVSNSISITSIGSNEADTTHLDNSVWIYYSDRKTQGIIRQRPDGSDKQVLLSSLPGVTKISDGKLYVFGDKELWQASMDGEIINNFKFHKQPGPIIESLEVCGNNIFYCIDHELNPGFDNKLIKEDLSTSKETELAEGFFQKITVDGNWIYYTYVGLNKIKDDGSSNTEIISGATGSMLRYDIPPFRIIDNAIFCILLDGDLIKVNKDGTGQTKMTDDQVTSFCIDNGWVYYSVYGHGIWNMKEDGTNCTKICDENAIIVAVKNNWIYYENLAANDTLHAIKTDGTNRTKITNHPVYSEYIL